MTETTQIGLEGLIRYYDIGELGYRNSSTEKYLDISGWFDNGLLIYKPFLALQKIIPMLYEYSGRKGTHHNQLYSELKQIVPWVPPGRSAYYLALHSCGFERNQTRTRYGDITIKAKLRDISEDSPERNKLFEYIGFHLTQPQERA